MKLSVIIPAYNEEKLIAGLLAKVFEALRTNAATDLTSEVIVVDNNSSDRTGKLARALGARVVFEPVNQIARARNAGASVAEGDWFLFVDADSWLSAATLADLLACIRKGGCAGGGCLIGLDQAPLLGRFIMQVWNVISRTTKWAAGSFVFCRADLFREIGGFPTDLFATEELGLSRKLKRLAKIKGLRITILRSHRHISSGRKFYLYSRGEMLQLIFRGLFTPWVVRDRKQLSVFYDGRR